MAPDLELATLHELPSIGRSGRVNVVRKAYRERRIAAQDVSARPDKAPAYRPGRGKSDYDPNPASYRPEIYGSDALQVLDAANVHKVVVIGTSLGGLLGMALAVFRPAALAAVIMNDIGDQANAKARRELLNYLSDNSNIKPMRIEHDRVGKFAPRNNGVHLADE